MCKKKIHFISTYEKLETQGISVAIAIRRKTTDLIDRGQASKNF